MKRSKHLIKKALAMALAGVMCMSLSLTAFAAENDPKAPGTPGFNQATDGSNEHGYPESMPAGEALATGGVVQNIDLYYAATDGVTGTDKDLGMIGVIGIEEGVTVKAYQIVKAEYGNAGLFSKWVDLTGIGLVDATGAVPAAINDGSSTGKGFTKDNIAKAALWARKNKETAKAYDMTQVGAASLDADGSVRTCTYEAEVEPGAYVIVVSGGEAKTYGAMVVSLSYQNFSTLHGWALGLAGNEAFAKMQDAPTIDKYITGAKAPWTAKATDDGMPDNNNIVNDVTGNGVTAAYGKGDKVYFDILVRNIPDYRGDRITFTVSDIMSKGLTFDPDDVQYAIVYNTSDGENVENNYYDGVKLKDEYRPENVGASGIVDLEYVPADGNEGSTRIVWNWTADSYKSGIGLYAGCDLIIRYGAFINGDKEFNEDNYAKMTNSARLDYTHNSLVEGDDDWDDVPNRHVYTFEFDVLKLAAELDAEDPAAKLSGAEFTLYAWADDSGKIYTNNEAADPAYFHIVTGAEAAGWFGDDSNPYAAFKPVTIATGDDGIAAFQNLAPGTYYLRETKAPGEYTINDHVYTIVITADYNDNEAKTLESVTYTVDGAETDTVLSKSHVVLDTRMIALPSTGGAGTALLVGLGVVGLIVGMFVIFGARKKEEQ